MTPAEAAALLTFMASLDGRRDVSESAARAWAEVGQQQGWTLPLAMRAAAEHYGTETTWAMPGHITARIEAARRAADARARAALPEPPRELADDPRAELAWRRRTAARMAADALGAWAAGGADRRALYAVEGRR